MSNAKESTTQLTELQGPTLDVAYDVSGRRMATCAASSSGSIVQVHECGPGSEGWTHVAAWETDQRVSHLTWAHPEYGRLLAGATTAGTLLVWGQVPELQASVGPAGVGASVGGGGEEGAVGAAYYQPLAELVCGTAECRAVCFAPRQAGLLLAALLADGSVAVHETEEVLAPRVWNLHSRIRAGPRDACRGLCWRPFTPGIPPMLCVGAGGEAQVWQFVLALNSWQLVARVPTANGHNVAAVHWAPPLGRPTELLAVAAGRDLLVYGMTGDTSAMRVEQLASLEHEEAVWRVEWDLWGNQVAAATDGQQVHVYRPDLVGSWKRVTWVQGQVPEE